MKALVIIAAVLLFFLLLSLAPLSVSVALKDGRAAIYLRYLLFKINLSPDKPAKKQAKKPGKKSLLERLLEKRKKKEPQEGEQEKKPGKKKPAAELAKTGLELLKASKRGLNTLRKHLVFSHVEVYVRVGGEDAHKTAVRYAQIGLIVPAALDVIGRMFVLKEPKVGIAPDFAAPKTRYELAVRVGMRPYFATLAVIRLLMDALPIFLRARGRKPKTPQRPKTAVNA